MADQKKLVAEITSMDEDFTQWYTDVVIKAGLIAYSNIKGFMVYKPAGYALWEAVQKHLDARFKAVGVENVYLPMMIPENLLSKESDLVNGFAPEVAWVTHGGSEELPERLCVRPTSETLFCDHWSHVVHSYRDLPMKYNQWCSVLRWEKTTRPFLRGREFLWQEGHTIHATEEEAREETLQMLEVYADCCEKVLAMPVIRGDKTEKEKFAGAVNTYTIECMMHDHKALQSGTSHFFGDGFTRAFNITFTDKENKLSFPYQTSWGMSTRVIGGLIMTHGDNNGLVLPPKVAPIQVIVVPVAQQKEGVLDKAYELLDRLKAAGIRARIDASSNSMGWKCAQWEMKGVPVRLEIGPRDIENNVCMAVRRDNGEKVTVGLEELESMIPQVLDQVQQGLFDKAKENLDSHIFAASSVEEAKALQEEHGGFIKTMWCGDLACEEKMKEEAGMSSRCIPFDQENLGDTCPCCGKPAKHMIYWGIAY